MTCSFPSPITTNPFTYMLNLLTIKSIQGNRPVAYQSCDVQQNTLLETMNFSLLPKNSALCCLVLNCTFTLITLTLQLTTLLLTLLYIGLITFNNSTPIFIESLVKKMLLLISPALIKQRSPFSLGGSKIYFQQLCFQRNGLCR